MAQRNQRQADYPSSNLKIIKTDVAPSGEAVQLVRPMAENSKTSADIIGDLVNRYDYKKNQLVKANDNDLTAINQAFGSNLASQLLKTYDGSAIVTDTQQDLIGERYLAEQIKRAHEYQKKNSVIDRYAHLLYEGDKDYKSNAKDDVKFYQSSASLATLRPVGQQEFVMQQSKLQPTASSVCLQQQQALQPPPQRQAGNNSQITSLQDQIRRLQEEKAALERAQSQLMEQQRSKKY